jgi:hypothetical protein
MNEQQRWAQDELRRVLGHFERDGCACSEVTKPPIGDGYHWLIAVARYLDEAGGSCERDTPRLLETLAEIILQLAGEASGPDDDGGADDPEDDPPLRPPPSEILDAFKLKEPAE